MLSAELILLVLLALAPRLAGLRRRYDEAALAPLAGDGTAADAAFAARLDAWTRDGAGTGTTLLPWAHPHAPVPLACARVDPTQEAAVRHYAYRLAGYHQLDGRSRVDSILYRLGVQLRPLLWFLPRRQDEPWDDAWLTEADAARVAALARWLPRRPTLIVLAGAALGHRAAVIAALQYAARLGDHPLRVLLLGAPDEDVERPGGLTDLS